MKKTGIVISFICMLLLAACAEKQTNPVKTDKTSSKQDVTEKATKDSAQVIIREEIDLSTYFKGVNGCAVFYSPEEGKYSLYHPSMCEKEVSPYSTFKIISALTGLENGIIIDETSTMNYNGTQYPISKWNGNLTLKDAFETSCIWYFRQVIDELGADEMAEALNGLQYGNCDISEWAGSGINPQKELNGFWLDSSLKISPLEQVKVISEIFEGNTSFSKENVDILKRIMLIETADDQKIYGKTGSGSDGKAWFVGFREKAGVKEYFAVYLDDEAHKDSINGNAAKEIALKILML